jgi:hypothetical protein
LHVARDVADLYIAKALDRRRDLLATAEQLREGIIYPTTAGTGRYHYVKKPSKRGGLREVYEEIIVPFVEAEAKYQKHAVEKAIRMAENQADLEQRYADDLTLWANKITGKVDAYRVEDLEPREWKVGDEVRIGGKGKDGFTARIEAIEDRPYQTRGWRIGGGTVIAAHARLTRPARPEKRGKPSVLYPDGCVITEGRPEKVIWEALRNIKRPADAVSALAEQLKAAGKL